MAKILRFKKVPVFIHLNGDWKQESFLVWPNEIIVTICQRFTSLCFIIIVFKSSSYKINF